MVYLVDDKKERQEKLGWTKEKIDGYKDLLMPIYDYNDWQAVNKQLFASGNVLLFHESFFDNPVNAKTTEALKIRKNISAFAEANNFAMVTFSGSMGARKISGNQANIPFEILYRNLDIFLQGYGNGKNIEIRKLAFGTNDRIEEIMHLKAIVWRALYDKKDEDLLVSNPTISGAVRDLELLSGKQIHRTDVTNGYLKFQIQQI